METTNRIVWDDIQVVNKDIKQIEIKRRYKDKSGDWQETKSKYVEVKERVIAFRKLFPTGQINSEITFSDNYVVCCCTIYDDAGHLLSKGHARELANKEFALENCETSAVGRALGFVGLGISTSIASAEEIKNVENNQIFDEPTPQDVKDLANEFRNLYTMEEQVKILNSKKVVEAELLGYEVLSKYVEHRKYGK